MNNIRKFTVLSLALALCHLMTPAFSFSQSDEESTLKEQKTKDGFLIDLKSLVNRSKKKIEEANDLIEEQDKFERNQQREEKAREYYEKGMKLYESGKYDKAVEFWERAVKITEHEEMKGYVGQSVKRTKKEQKALTEAEKRRLEQLEKERGYSAKEVEKSYAKGVSYFKRNNFIKAREEFEKVEKMFPDHKATRSYLMLIGQKITSEQNELITQKLEEDSQAYADGKENWKSELEEKAKQRREKLEEQADKIYNEAVQLYKTKQYVSAKERFKEVEWILPNYKSTIKYLRKLDKTIEVDEVLTQEDKQRLFEKQLREERLVGDTGGDFKQLQSEDKAKEVQKRLEEEAEFVYNSAIALFKKKNYVESKDMFMETEKILPDYKKTRKYLANIEKKIPEYQRDLLEEKEEEVVVGKEKDGETIKRDVMERREKFAKEAESKYNEAMAFYNARNYVEAKLKFIQVEALYPDYLDTRDYLASIDGKISEQVASGDEKAIRGLQVAWRDDAKQHVAPEPSIPVAATDDVKELYKSALAYYKNGQFEQARTIFMQVQDIQPGYKGVDKYLDNIYEKMAKQDRVQQKDQERQGEGQKLVSNGQFKDEASAKYKEALGLFKQKRYIDSRAKFVEVNELVPGYKSTEKYIKRLTKLVPSLYYEKDDAPAAKVKEVHDLGDAPAALKDEAEAHYQQAISYYKSREFTNARRSFTKVEDMVPDYKMTSVYLSRIAKLLGPEAALLESDKGEGEADGYVADEKERRLDQKREKTASARSEKTLVKSFSEQKVNLEKDEKEYKKQKRIVEQLKKEEHQKDLYLYEDKVKVLYDEAVKLYKDKDYDLAMRQFRSIDGLHPDYRSTRHYMTQIDRIRIINEEKSRLSKEIEETRIVADEARKAAEELKKEQRSAAKRSQEAAIDKPMPVEPGATAEGVDIDKDILVQKMAQEWKAAEERADTLAQDLREKELSLRWRLNQEERIAQLMAQDAELERLEDLKYKDFRKDLDRSHAEEEKALEESNKRVEERIEQLKNEYKAKKALQAKAAGEAKEEWEHEYDVLKKERDNLAEIIVNDDEEEAAVAAIKADAKAKAAPERRIEVKSSEAPISRAEMPKQYISDGDGEIGAEASFKDGVDASLINNKLLVELESLEKTIKEQEAALSRDRQLAQERLQREAARRAELASKRQYEQVPAVAPQAQEKLLSFEERYEQLSEEENEEALEKLIKARQRELRGERERIRQQFEESLDELYSKAVDLYNAGMANDAQRLFHEVKAMAPGYKKTDHYLKALDSSARQVSQPQMSSNNIGQSIIHPTPRELKTRDSMISSALDTLEQVE